jgi:hypothetical protein
LNMWLAILAVAAIVQIRDGDAGHPGLSRLRQRHPHTHRSRNAMSNR